MGAPVLVLLATALAAEPGGLRLDSGLPEHELRIRDAWVVRDDGPDGAHQVLVDGQVPLSIGPFPLVAEVEVPVVHRWDHGASNLGGGQLRLAVRLWGEGRQGDRRIAVTTWGVELAVPSRLMAPEGAWVLHSVESLPALEALYVVESSFRSKRDGWLHLRMGAGFRRPQQQVSLQVWPLQFTADVGVAWIQPLVGPLALGTELEVIRDEVPVATRHWLRTGYGRGVSFDAGVHLPWRQLVSGPREVGFVAQLSWRPTS